MWRYPDLTPQVEYLGRAIDRAVRMVPEEPDFLVHYERSLRQAKEVVEMPNAGLADLLPNVHGYGGSLSENTRKQRFRVPTDDEIG